MNNIKYSVVQRVLGVKVIGSYVELFDIELNLNDSQRGKYE